MAITQRTLYKTIEKIGSREYDSQDDMLIAILHEMVENTKINAVGGRIWKLEADANRYRLLHEKGNIESVGVGYSIDLQGHAVFEEVARKRTVLANETHRGLKKKGDYQILRHRDRQYGQDRKNSILRISHRAQHGGCRPRTALHDEHYRPGRHTLTGQTKQ